MGINKTFLKSIIYLTLFILFVSIIFDIFTSAYYRAIIWAAFFIIFLILLKKSKIPRIALFYLSLLLLLVILGEYFLYNLIPFFDKIVHFLSQLIICPLILYLTKDKIKDKKLLVLFCIAFAITLSVVWEITEYSFDHAVDSKMQGVYFQEGQFFGTYERLYTPILTEIDDTMSDLIFNAIGACTFGFLYLLDLRKRKKNSK